MKKKVDSVKLAEMHKNGKIIKEALMIVVILSRLSFTESDFGEDCDTEDIATLKDIILNSRAIKEDVIDLCSE